MALVAIPARASVEVVLTSGRVLTADRVAHEGDDVVLISAAGTVRVRAAQVQAIRDASAASQRGPSVAADGAAKAPDAAGARTTRGDGPAWARVPWLAPLVREGDLAQAEERLRRERIGAGDPLLDIALGEILNLRGRFALAKDVLGSGAALPDPLRLPHALALAEALTRLDRVDEARRVLDAAPEDGSGAVEAARRDLVADDAASTGPEASSAHFLVHGLPDSRSSDLEALLPLLEEVHASLEAMLHGSPRERIVVLLYPGDTFWEATGEGAQVLGLYDGKVRVPAGRITPPSSQLQATLRHEVTHAFVDALSSGRADAWWQEGFAEHVEGADASPRVRALKAALRASPDDWPPPLSHANAHARMEWFLGRYGIEGFRDVLAGLATQGTIGRALQSAVGLSESQLTEAWRQDLGR
jgi:hypothetical protein